MLTEGVCRRVVEAEVPENIQEMHEASLTEGRDVLRALLVANARFHECALIPTGLQSC